MRRETAGAYLKAAGIRVRAPGGWGRRAPAIPANEVTTDSSESKPANEVTTDFGPSISLPTGNQDRVTSACEPYRELEQGLGRGRNAMAIWQDLVTQNRIANNTHTSATQPRAYLQSTRGIIPPPPPLLKECSKHAAICSLLLLFVMFTLISYGTDLSSMGKERNSIPLL